MNVPSHYRVGNLILGKTTCVSFEDIITMSSRTSELLVESKPLLNNGLA